MVFDVLPRVRLPARQLHRPALELNQALKVAAPFAAFEASSPDRTL